MKIARIGTVLLAACLATSGLAVASPAQAAAGCTATRAVVTLSVEETALRLEVRDNGVNAEDSWQPGVGLTSIRERTAELGGASEIRYDRTGGQVRVSLPLPSPATGRVPGVETGAGS